MRGASAGIHHITVIAGDPQRSLEFYAGVLGLRLVKKTVNYDDPETYHFYFADGAGTPGTILTFFPWTSSGLKGRAGAGQVTGIAFSVPDGALGFWRNRLQRLHVELDREKKIGPETRIAFHDPDGLALELAEAGDRPSSFAWTDQVPEEDAIRGFHSATLTVENADITAEFLSNVLGLQSAGEAEGRLVLSAPRGGAGGEGMGTRVEIVNAPAQSPGRVGVGAVHHIAWRAKDDEEQRALRAAVVATGAPATPVIDRLYFHSVYFHEPNRILFEIATDPPGFTRDEPLDSLGTQLKLPPWLEKLRPGLEKALPPLNVASALMQQQTQGGGPGINPALMRRHEGSRSP
ncbi:MAG: ring-cleaving dioxygenase [Spirochaetia bacterium]